MARVWFVRRVGERWKAPGGRPAYERPLDQLIFRLDIGWQRRQADDTVVEPLGDDPPRDLGNVTKVFTEVLPADLEAQYPGYRLGWYDSPYSPQEATRRLGPPQWDNR